MKVKFFSIISGNDQKYSLIKDNFQKHLNNVELSDEHKLIKTSTDSGDWQDKGFLDTVIKKLDFTRDFLKEGYYVFCSDLDIIFLRNPLSYLKDLIQGYDIIFQNDYAEVDNGEKVSIYCTGFYFVRPSSLTIKLFDRSVNTLMSLNKIYPKLITGQKKKLKIF